MNNNDSSAAIPANRVLGDAEFVIAGNRLIGVFMGGEMMEGRQNNVYWFKAYHHILTKYKAINVHAFKYHSSWDWLIPALAEAEIKINEADFNVITEKEAWSRLKAALNEVCNLNIKNAHFCFVKFIEWWNKNAVSNSIA